MYFVEEVELEDMEVGSLITGVKIAEVVKQLHSNSAPGVNEICPKFPQAL